MKEVKSDIVDMSGQFREYTPAEFEEYMKTTGAEDADFALKEAAKKREEALNALSQATGVDIEVLRLI